MTEGEAGWQAGGREGENGVCPLSPSQRCQTSPVTCVLGSDLSIPCVIKMSEKVNRLKKAEAVWQFFQFTLIIRRKLYLNFFQYICSISEWSVFASIIHLFGFGTCWSKTTVNTFLLVNNSNGILYFFAF